MEGIFPPCKATFQQLPKFFLYLAEGRPLITFLFCLAWILLQTKLTAGCSVIFEKSCPPREVKPLEWNLSTVLRSLTHLPYKPLKLSVDKHLTWKSCFLLALASPKLVSELHGFSCQVCHWKEWRFCTFCFIPGFVARTQNSSVYDSIFKEFTIPSLADFVDENR